MICLCLLYLYANCLNSPEWKAFVQSHIVADDPWDKRRNGPWGLRPEDAREWNVDWENWK